MANINTMLREAHITLIDHRDAKRRWQAFRVANGWAPIAPLLTPPPKPGARKTPNLKLAKDKSVVTYGLALAQANTVGLVKVKLPDGSYLVTRITTCPFSTPACRAGCVSQNGNGRYDQVQRARQLKTRFLLEDPDAFCSLLAHELEVARAKHGAKLRVRLNTFSDIRWEEVAPQLFTSGISFYDYTKDWTRTPPANYRLTLSASERTSDRRVRDAVAAGRTVAVVFDTPRTKALPATWHGLMVIDGDKSDNRADDANGVVVGLRAKGSMRGDTRGMVRKAS